MRQNCARLRRGSLLVLYKCLLQIVIVEVPTLLCVGFGSLTMEQLHVTVIRM